MKHQPGENLHTYFLLLIILIATVMRLWQFDFFSYSNDELSAITRLDYNSFSDLIEYGVKRNDFHPAGVQLFLYYWTKIVGTSEFVVRFPFVITGILAVLFSYLVAKKWFGKNTALFTATAVAALNYPILYSQIARPYSPGLFFCMAGVYFWSRLIFENQWKDYKIVAGYVLFSSLAAYTHHFSFLFMIIVGATGLFLVKRIYLKTYLLAAILVFVLYLPHLPVFLYQFGIGGIGGEEGWLGKPKEDWFWKYLTYIFNDSGFLIYLTAILLITAIIYRIANKNIKLNKYHIISLFWFLILFFIGYYYSIYRNPVLQYSILIFSFPFLFLFLFSFIPEISKKYIYLVLLIFTSAVVYSTVFEKDYYNQQHFGEFKDITLTVDAWHNKYGRENISQAVRTNDRKYLDYYFKRNGKEYEFLQYDIFDREAFLELKNNVQESQTKYFLFAWTLMGAHTPEDIIRSKYPCIIEQKKYAGLSYISLYAKETEGTCFEEKPLVNYSTDFASGHNWDYNQEYITDTLGKVAALLTGIEFGPTFTRPLREVSDKELKKVRITYKAYSENVGDAQMVLAFDVEGTPAYEWHSVQIDYFQKSKEWFDVINTFKLPEIKSKDDVIKIYLWNVNKSAILIGDLNIEFFDEE